MLHWDFQAQPGNPIQPVVYRPTPPKGSGRELKEKDVNTLPYLQFDRERLRRRVGNMEQIAGIRLVQASDGRARGSRLLSVWTGTGLTFEIAVDRALDIASCHYRGVPLAWISPVGYVHPAYYQPTDWERSYQGGLFATCGLDHFGPPASVNGTAYFQHGRVDNLPAQNFSYRAYWNKEQVGPSRYILEARSTIRQVSVFGENITLQRHISTALGSNKIRIRDIVTNDGFSPQRHVMFYHCNIGYPLVCEDSKLHVEVNETLAHDDESSAGLIRWRELQPPTRGYHEQNFWHDPVTDADGLVHVELENPTLHLGLRWTYEKSSLPSLLQWKMMGEGTYLMGIEPGNIRWAKGRTGTPEFKITYLAPDESRSYVLELEVVDSTSS